MKSKIASIILTLLMVCSLLSYSAVAVVLPEISNTSLNSTINAYATDKTVSFSSSDSVRLKSFSNDSYTYTMHLLSPYGYAIIYDENGALMEACYAENAAIPFPLNSEKDLYYGGPFNYFLKEGNNYISISDDYVLNSTDIAYIVNRESGAVSSTIRSGSRSTSVDNLTTVTTSDTSSFVAESYFENLTDFGINANGTCTVIASAILLGYYDYYVNDSFVSSEYEQGNGTSEAFHQLLNNYVYGSQSQGGINIRNALSGLNSYLASRNLTARFQSVYQTANSARSKIISELNSGKPVIASVAETYGAEWNHTVLVYGATYDSSDPLSTAVLQFHCGWHSSTADNAHIASIGWFYECGYITCVYGHTFRPWQDSDARNHVRTCRVCQYEEVEAHQPYWDSVNSICERCGRTDPIDTAMRRMNNTIVQLIINEEE